MVAPILNVFIFARRKAVIKIANTPCSWRVLELALEGQAVGYPQVLDEMHAPQFSEIVQHDEAIQMDMT
jgi:hypothetical protein